MYLKNKHKLADIWSVGELNVHPSTSFSWCGSSGQHCHTHESVRLDITAHLLLITYFCLFVSVSQGAASSRLAAPVALWGTSELQS